MYVEFITKQKARTSKTTNDAYVYVPKEYAGRDVYIIIPKESKYRALSSDDTNSKDTKKSKEIEFTHDELRLIEKFIKNQDK